MQSSATQVNKWTEVIKPRRSLFDLRLKDVWEYRDLLRMFVRRDFLASYKQTLLGPLWFFIQPILTTIMFTFVFGRVARIQTGDQPQILFYLGGLTIWNYFAEGFNRTSSVFTANAGIFGKVYFPRLITPLSIIVSGLMKFAVQLSLFLAIWIYYLITKPASLQPNTTMLLVPLLVLLMAGYALGIGMIVSSLTTKYRDLSNLISFGVTLLMYATPIIYPISFVPEKYRWLVQLNPLAPIIETFRHAFLGGGTFSWPALAYSSVVMFLLLVSGVLVFNKVERTFMDTV
jgi:lipopolysaccharide transport system permease protein